MYDIESIIEWLDDTTGGTPMGDDTDDVQSPRGLEYEFLGRTCEVCGAPADQQYRDVRVYVDGGRERVEPLEWHYRCRDHEGAWRTIRR